MRACDVPAMMANQVPSLSRSMDLHVAEMAVSILVGGDPIELEQSSMMTSTASGLPASGFASSPSSSWAEMVTIA